MLINKNLINKEKILNFKLNLWKFDKYKLTNIFQKNKLKNNI